MLPIGRSLNSIGDTLFSSIDGGPPLNQQKANQRSLFNSLLDPNIELPTISATEVDDVFSSLISSSLAKNVWGESKLARHLSDIHGSNDSNLLVTPTILNRVEEQLVQPNCSMLSSQSLIISHSHNKNDLGDARESSNNSNPGHDDNVCLNNSSNGLPHEALSCCSFQVNAAQPPFIMKTYIGSKGGAGEYTTSNATHLMILPDDSTGATDAISSEPSNSFENHLTSGNTGPKTAPDFSSGHELDTHTSSNCMHSKMSPASEARIEIEELLRTPRSGDGQIGHSSTYEYASVSRPKTSLSPPANGMDSFSPQREGCAIPSYFYLPPTLHPLNLHLHQNRLCPPSYFTSKTHNLRSGPCEIASGSCLQNGDSISITNASKSSHLNAISLTKPSTKLIPSSDLDPGLSRESIFSHPSGNDNLIPPNISRTIAYKLPDASLPRSNSISFQARQQHRFKFICPYENCGRRYLAETGLSRHLLKYHNAAEDFLSSLSVTANVVRSSCSHGNSSSNMNTNTSTSINPNISRPEALVSLTDRLSIGTSISTHPVAPSLAPPCPLLSHAHIQSQPGPEAIDLTREVADSRLISRLVGKIGTDGLANSCSLDNQPLSRPLTHHRPEQMLFPAPSEASTNPIQIKSVLRASLQPLNVPNLNRYPEKSPFPSLMNDRVLPVSKSRVSFAK